jgi:hypothetical protein
MQHELSKAVSAPMAAQQRAAAQAVAQAEERLARIQEHLHTTTDEPEKRGSGCPPKVAVSLEQIEQDVDTTRQEHQRLIGQRERGSESIRPLGHVYHFVDLDRGVRRNGKLIAGDIQHQIDTIRTMAQQEALSQACLDRIEKAERVVPKMRATIECVAAYVRRQVHHLDLTPPQSYAVHAPLIPSYYLERVASTKTRTAGEPLRALAEHIRAPLCASEGALGDMSPMEQKTLKAKAATLAEVFQRSSSNVEGRNGYLSLRNHQLRGLDHPRKRACLTALHNFFLTRADGTTAAERFFGQKPRSMFAAILASVAIPPAPLSPPRRALG